MPTPRPAACAATDSAIRPYSCVVGLQGPIHGGDCRGTVYPVAVAAVDLVRRSYDAFARDDLDAVMADMHPEIEWHQAQGLPHGGLYHGLDEVRRNIFDPLDEQWWDEFTADPEEFLDAGLDVVVVGRYRGIAKGRANNWTSPSSISGRCRTTRQFASASSSIRQVG